jgi:hypothetical protein
LTLRQVADQLYCSVSKISRIETAHVAPTVRDVRDLLDLYKVTSQQREELLRLALEARKRGPWWHAFKGVQEFRAFFDLERIAVSICIYECLLVPGLLQTEAYASLVLTSFLPDLTRQEIERLIELRLLRQSTIGRDDPPIVEVVVDESALHRLVGGRGVMHRQLRRLLAAAALPNISFQVLPFAAGEHGGMGGPFTMLQLPGASEPELVLLEHPSGELYLDRRELVAVYERLFRRLQAIAMTPDQSVDFLTKLADELDRADG